AGLNPEEPYRRALTFMRERIRATHARADGAYAEPDELLADLRRVEASLGAGQGALTAGSDLRDVIRQVEVFGFHFARLDIREHARVHRRALGEIYGTLGVCDDYDGLPDEERVALLQAQIAGHSSPPTSTASPRTRRTRSAPSAPCARRWRIATVAPSRPTSCPGARAR